MVYFALFKSFQSIQAGLPPFKKVDFICFKESLLKKKKNAFYFIIKALFVLQILKFCPDLFGYVGKLRQIPKFMTSQTGTQVITMNILPDISNSKGSQTNEIWSVNKI